MLILYTLDSNGDHRELGVFSGFRECSEEIGEHELNDSNTGKNIRDFDIKALDLETKFTYIYTPPDPTQEPTELYDPERQYDWTLEIIPIT